MKLFTNQLTVPDQHAVVTYPTEFFNSLKTFGMPPHILQLKVGVPVYGVEKCGLTHVFAMVQGAL